MEEREDNIDDLDIQFDAKEMQLIEQIRREELLKQTLKAEKEDGSNMSNTYLKLQLQEKDKKIEELTRMVNRFDAGRHLGPSPAMAEILAISDEVNKNRS